MCGRFVQAQDPTAYADYFGAGMAVAEALTPSWNVAPTDRVWAVAEDDGERLLGQFRWGLVPFWAKSRKIGARHINARAETVADKPAFRDSFTGRRCIVPADGFYEWERVEGKGKKPHYIFGADAAPLAFAGLWASWRDRDSDERLVSCTIITTRPNELLQPIHDRMPVVLPAEQWGRWLDRSFGDTAALQSMLHPLSSEAFGEYPVSTLVNSVKNNFAECLAPL